MTSEIDKARGRFLRLWQEDPRPWHIAYSGGKDSTLLLQLALEVAREQSTPKEIIVAFNDTRYEVDGKLERIERNFSRIAATGLAKPKILRPKPRDTILVRIIGDGYAPPDFRFRYCTRYSKMDPSLASEKELAARSGGCLTFSGTRKEESTDRLRRLTKNGSPESLIPRRKRLKIDDSFPLADVKTSELWGYLEGLGTFIWGETIDELKELYPGDTVAQRDGCWLCTVCAEKSSCEKQCTPGQTKIRRFIRAIKEDPEKRRLCKLENHKKRLEKGLASGYFTMEARQEILDVVQEVEREENRRYISDEEIAHIREIWGGGRKGFYLGNLTRFRAKRKVENVRDFD
ncbi:MAG: phosphoadenosine phosphosulfate reductase family protein [Thermoguttaceae bacterium]|nr:phosphoadenosine phosphosulfate reductase family protein [Thermoguttaceae bacterium]